MNYLNRLAFGSALVLSTFSLRGAPPDSLVGKILHLHELQVATRAATERALRFNADGSYTYIFAAGGSALNVPAPWKFFITKPTATSGTYDYLRMSESTASLTLSEGGHSTTYTVTYKDDVSGRVNMFGSDNSVFYLTDNTDIQRAPLSNFSLRGRVSNGHPLIGGIIVPGEYARFFLVRVVGPSLAQFGVSELWADPDFTIYSGTEPEQLMEVHYSDWSSNPFYSPDRYDTVGGFTYLFKQLGLFELMPNSKDAVALVWLPPGAHTIVCSAAANDPGGEALIEVYSIP